MKTKDKPQWKKLAKHAQLLEMMSISEIYVYIDCLQCSVWTLAQRQKSGRLQEWAKADHLYHWRSQLFRDEVCLPGDTGLQELGNSYR